MDSKWFYFQRNQRTKLRIHSVGPTGLQKSAMLNPLVKSHWGCRLTPGQMSFHGRNEDVWPNPLFPLIKMDISELSEGEVWVFRDSRWLLADSGLPFPIGSISPVAPPPTVWYSGFPMSPKPAQLWQAVHFSLNGTHTLIYWDSTLFWVRGAIPTFQLRKYIISPSSCNACRVTL